MTGFRRTWRDVDGERIEGTWRHAFVRNGKDYYLSDLIIYADGMIDCSGLHTLDGLAATLRSGRVATTLEDGARGSAHHVASWRFAEPQSWVTPEMLLGEVRDEIDRLNGRPDSSRRAVAAAEAYCADQSEANREALLDAYLAIPEHLRHYALGDMDYKDRPLKVLARGVGAELDGGSTITEEMHQAALNYFAQREQIRARYEAREPADGPDGEPTDSVYLNQVVYPRGWPADAGILVLRNEFPATITVGGRTYPSVTHAYWALSTDDSDQSSLIAAEENPAKAEKIASSAPRRAGWERARVAVMANLLRAKFDQHSDLARVLTDTGQARILYADGGSSFWGQQGLHGRNWMGRLLELVRAERAARDFDL